VRYLLSSYKIDELEQFDEEWSREADNKLISAEQAGRLLRMSTESIGELPPLLLPPITRSSFPPITSSRPATLPRLR
jgi:hypothetical protein